MTVDILLIEDDQRLAGLTAGYLRQNDLSVAVESQGDSALDAFRREQPRIGRYWGKGYILARDAW